MSNNKRESNSVVLAASSLILDIEGTTSSISFVKDVLFPYVRKHLEAYINGNWESTNLQDIVEALKTQAKEDEANKMEGVIIIPDSEEKDVLAKSIIENVNWQMDNDRKTKSLKDLQGLIMEEGYTKGDLKGHVYDDVEPNLKSWAEQGKSIYIYSSGSVHAQKLLFGHSEKGDLLPLIKGHYDTSVGMKGDEGSYKKILEELSLSPSEAAFLTDIPKEARAAKSARMFAVLVSREGNTPLTDEDKDEFPVITSFADIDFESNSKKRKICTENNVNSENKPVELCTVSVEKVKPNDPLTTNSCVEMMEVDENADADKEKTTQDVDNKTTVADTEELDKAVQNEANQQEQSKDKINCETESSDAGVVNGVTKECDKTLPSEMETADDKLDKEAETKEIIKKDSTSGKEIKIIVSDTDGVETGKPEIEEKMDVKPAVCSENKTLETNGEIPSDKAQNPLTETKKTGSDEVKNSDDDKKVSADGVCNDGKASEDTTVKGPEVENSVSENSKIESKVNDKNKPTDAVLADNVASTETVKETEAVLEEKTEPVTSESKNNIESVSASGTNQPSEVVTENSLGVENKATTAEEEVKKDIVADTENKVTNSNGADKTETTSQEVESKELTEDNKAKISEEEVKKDIVADEKMDTDSKVADKTDTTSQTVESKELTDDKDSTSEKEVKKDVVDEKMDIDTKAADKTETTSQTEDHNKELTEDKTNTSEKEAKKNFDEKTETTSQTVDGKELSEDKNETKVPSNDKAEVNGKLNGVEEKITNGKLTNGNSSEEKTGIANGSSSPEISKEAESTKDKVIEAKKCDVTENAAPDTVVEA